VGWRLVYITAVGVALVCLASYAIHGADEAGVHHLLRVTARLSLGLFSLTFAASPLHQLFGVSWPLAHRRYLGVSFAVAHGYHLMAIVALAKLHGAGDFARTQGATLWAGAFGYLLVAAMVATSFDGSAAWLGRRRWKILHAGGVYGLGAFFVFTYVVAAVERGGAYVFFAAVALAAPALRVAAWIRSRRAPAR